MFNWWAVSILQTLIAKVVNVLYKRSDLASGFAPPHFSFVLFFGLDVIARQSLAQNGYEWSIAGKENTVELSCSSRCFVAVSSPTSVLPAPGTPVTKQIDLCDLFLDELITSAIASDVRLRLIAFASLREISRTECPLYRASAASMIVGVGQ